MKPIPNSLRLKLRLDQIDPKVHKFILDVAEMSYNEGYNDAKREIIFSGSLTKNNQN